MKHSWITAAVVVALAATGLFGQRVTAQSQTGHAKPAVAVRPKADAKAAGRIKAAKAKATAAGTYECCLKHSCDLCALHTGKCGCGKMAEAGKPVCNECKGGWDAGDGDTAGKTPQDIKTRSRG